jgi:hypothetical protein
MRAARSLVGSAVIAALLTIPAMAGERPEPIYPRKAEASGGASPWDVPLLWPVLVPVATIGTVIVLGVLVDELGGGRRKSRPVSTGEPDR